MQGWWWHAARWAMPGQHLSCAIPARLCYATLCFAMQPGKLSVPSLQGCAMPCWLMKVPALALLFSLQAVPCQALPYHTVLASHAQRHHPYMAVPCFPAPCHANASCPGSVVPSMLLYAMPCHAVPCYDVPCHVVSSCPMLCHAVPGHDVLYYPLPCLTVPSTPCCAMVSHAMLCHPHHAQVAQDIFPAVHNTSLAAQDMLPSGQTCPHQNTSCPQQHRTHPLQDRTHSLAQRKAQGQPQQGLTAAGNGKRRQ